MLTLVRDTVSVIRAEVTLDEYGATIYDWTSPTVVTTGLASVQPSFGTEQVTDRQTTDQSWRLISDDTRVMAALTAVDRVVWQGNTLNVEGEPHLWRLRDRDHHVEAQLRRITG